MTRVGEQAHGMRGRVRLSTWILLGLFLAALATYILVRPAVVAVYRPVNQVPPTTTSKTVPTTTRGAATTTRPRQSTSTTAAPTDHELHNHDHHGGRRWLIFYVVVLDHLQHHHDSAVRRSRSPAWPTSTRTPGGSWWRGGG